MLLCRASESLEVLFKSTGKAEFFSKIKKKFKAYKSYSEAKTHIFDTLDYTNRRDYMF